MPSKKHGADSIACTLYVSGMHCSSCELLIEKKLIKHDQVLAVDVSRKDNAVHITLAKGTKIEPQQLNAEFQELGYTFGIKPIAKPRKPIFVKRDDGRWQMNGDILRRAGKTAVIAMVFLAAFMAVERLQMGRFVSVNATSSLAAFFLLGLVAGMSSCAALIGGLLLSLVKHWHDAHDEATGSKATPHLLFHSGRLAAFMVGGGILGMAGSRIAFTNTTVFAVVVLAVSAVMTLLALQMLDIAWAQKIRLGLPRFVTRAAADERRMSGKYAPLGIGAATFFLPCGFTLIAQGVALASGSFARGSLVMLLFALGTLPMLAGISATGLHYTKKPHLTARFSAVAGLLIIFFALYNVNGQMNVLGYPSLSDWRIFQSRAEMENLTGDIAAGESGAMVNGRQTIRLVAQGFAYKPVGPTVFTANVPTYLEIEDKGVVGCGAYLAARGLFDGYVPLNPGQNLVDVGSPRAGNYKITCTMGMVPPVTVTFQ